MNNLSLLLDFFVETSHSEQKLMIRRFQTGNSMNSLIRKEYEKRKIQRGRHQPGTRRVRYV